MLYIEPAFAATLLPSEQRFSHLVQFQGQIYREQEGRKTLRFAHRGKHYFLKVHTGVGWKEIIKNLLQLRLPIISARPEWCAIHKLNELGIDTATPVAYGNEGINPAARRSFIIFEDLGDTISLEDVFSMEQNTSSHLGRDVGLRRTMIRKLAIIARTLHMNGVNHRDFYLCHIHVPRVQTAQTRNPEDLQLYIIDLHRAQIRKKTPVRWIVKDLGGLLFSSLEIGLTTRDLYRFLTVYHDEPLRNCFAKHSPLWRRIRKRSLRLYRKLYPERVLRRYLHVVLDHTPITPIIM